MKIKTHHVLAMLLGASLAVMVVAVGTAIVLRQNGVPELSTESFSAAQRRWHQQAPESYTIETQVRGLQPAVYRVSVANGQVTSATRDGAALRDQRTLGTWSVPGMFDTIQRDVNTNADAEGPELLQLRAEFDEQFGYPERYVRLAWGTKVTTSWQVTEFTIGGVNVTPNGADVTSDDPSTSSGEVP